MNRKEIGTHTFPCSFVFVCLFAQRNAKAFTFFGFFVLFVFFFGEERLQLFFESSHSLNFVIVYHTIENRLTYF